MLIHYIRDKKNNKVGAVVGVKNGDTVYVGWSQCAREDRFNKKTAVDMAALRALGGTPADSRDSPTIPHDIRRFLPEFYGRLYRYFKDAKTFSNVEYVESE